jgi:transcriptional regulator with XRE-family HTH domain
LDNLAAKISNTLKTLRSGRGWSLDATSQKTGVSKAMLGQIERGESSPTISILWKIASGFEVSFSSFVEDLPQSQEEFIHRQQDLKQLHQKDNQIRIMSLFPYDEELKFEVFIIELLPGCEHLSAPHQKGVIEHVIVSKGEIEIFNGVWHTVKQNEGVRFCADKPHGYYNKSSKPAVFHNIIHYTQS